MGIEFTLPLETTYKLTVSVWNSDLQDTEHQTTKDSNPWATGNINHSIFTYLPDFSLSGMGVTNMERGKNRMDSEVAD